MAMNKLTLGGGALLGLGCLLHIVALATPGWATYAPLSIGLWDECIGDACHPLTSAMKTGVFQGSQAMAILGMIAALVAVGTAAFMLFKERKEEDFPSYLGLASLVASMVSSVFIMMGIVMFAADFIGNSGFGYSFGLSIVGALLILAGGILTFFSR